jgi:hypothetical protein
MKSKTNRGIQKAGRVDHLQGGGPNWVLVAGGVLLSTLSVKLGCKLKQMFDTKQHNSSPKGLMLLFAIVTFIPFSCSLYAFCLLCNTAAERRPAGCESHSNLCRFRGQTSCYSCISGASSVT